MRLFNSDLRSFCESRQRVGGMCGLVGWELGFWCMLVVKD